jgi:hypothetical protein
VNFGIQNDILEINKDSFEVGFHVNDIDDTFDEEDKENEEMRVFHNLLNEVITHFKILSPLSSSLFLSTPLTPSTSLQTIENRSSLIQMINPHSLRKRKN